jgi:hypothetical protein
MATHFPSVEPRENHPLEILNAWALLITGALLLKSFRPLNGSLKFRPVRFLTIFPESLGLVGVFLVPGSTMQEAVSAWPMPRTLFVVLAFLCPGTGQTCQTAGTRSGRRAIQTGFSRLEAVFTPLPGFHLDF